MQKNRTAFKCAAIGISTVVAVCLGKAVLWGYVRWAENVCPDRQVAPYIKRMAAIHQTPEYRAFKELQEAITESRGAKVPDQVQGVAMSSLLYRTVVIQGESFGLYYPNMEVRQCAVWTGFNYQKWYLPVDDRASRALARCRVVKDVCFRANEYGFKGTGQPRDPEKPSILFCGDSFTEGVWVRPEDTFVARFNRKMQLDGFEAQALNLGISGYSARESCCLIQQYSRLFNARMAVLNLFPNDVIDDHPGTQQPWDPGDGYACMFHYVSGFVQHCLAEGITVVVSAIPDRCQFSTRSQDWVFQARIRAWCKEHDIVFLDPGDYFDGKGVAQVYFHWDTHFSPGGHRHYADFLYASLRAMLAVQFPSAEVRTSPPRPDVQVPAP
ncbi:MAG: hypothetical protein A3K19_32170 [Lentisphaerae bacterium RIFOXYB12_FULL_65_16]|nr:MAG: hypothetical protein A3K18_10950 [Lentisphaerae bacterium RIFOXYA12_64_32]OGV88758.1 MAG: hypothetical protein A3K19_32170 [Lentisphaerae bacterium RIFOXYB12_FULL_65_16]